MRVFDEHLSELKPCPFCGAGETFFDAVFERNSTVMSEALKLRHTCLYGGAVIVMVGSDLPSLVARWNKGTGGQDGHR